MIRNCSKRKLKKKLHKKHVERHKKTACLEYSADVAVTSYIYRRKHTHTVLTNKKSLTYGNNKQFDIQILNTSKIKENSHKAHTHINSTTATDRPTIVIITSHHLILNKENFRKSRTGKRRITRKIKTVFETLTNGEFADLELENS